MTEMITASELAQFRADAESLMTATCVVRRATGAYTIVPGTDSEVAVYADVFTSPCKVQSRQLAARQEEVGGRTATTVSVELHLPVIAAVVRVGDVAEVTAVASVADPQLVGRKFTIACPVGKNYLTARRFEVTEVVS